MNANRCDLKVMPIESVELVKHLSLNDLIPMRHGALLSILV